MLALAAWHVSERELTSWIRDHMTKLK